MANLWLTQRLRAVGSWRAGSATVRPGSRVPTPEERASATIDAALHDTRPADQDKDTGEPIPPA